MTERAVLAGWPGKASGWSGKAADEIQLEQSLDDLNTGFEMLYVAFVESPLRMLFDPGRQSLDHRDCPDGLAKQLEWRGYLVGSDLPQFPVDFRTLLSVFEDALMTDRFFFPERLADESPVERLGHLALDLVPSFADIVGDGQHVGIAFVLLEPNGDCMSVYQVDQIGDAAIDHFVRQSLELQRIKRRQQIFCLQVYQGVDVSIGH